MTVYVVICRKIIKKYDIDTIGVVAVFADKDKADLFAATFHPEHYEYELKTAYFVENGNADYFEVNGEDYIMYDVVEEVVIP